MTEGAQKDSVGYRLSFSDYSRVVSDTDRFNQDSITPVVFGLFGEVGGILSSKKKKMRDSKAYPEYKVSITEEFGDVLWYLTALCRRVDQDVGEIFNEISSRTGGVIISAGFSFSHPVILEKEVIVSGDSDQILTELGIAATQLLQYREKLEKSYFLYFVKAYVDAMSYFELSLFDVMQFNIKKVKGRFLNPDYNLLPDFDKNYPEEEQLPRFFSIKISQRASGLCFLRWNDVFIGSPLNDSIEKSDDYRFHDVFHFAFAAVLHWSPTFRSLIKQKRKSNPEVDDAEDGGRAIVVEEGLSAWLFSYAKGVDFYEGHDSVSFDVLKIVQRFVKGFEVEQCPLALWERAILQGYEVFRMVRLNNGGIVIGDRESRTLTYQKLESK